MNLYLVTNEPLAYGQYDSLLLVAYEQDDAKEQAIDEYNFDSECNVTLIGRAAGGLVEGDLVIGGCTS